MEHTKQDTSVEANFNDRSVKEITTPAKSVLSDASVESALGDMHGRGVDSSSVVDQDGVLLGSVSKDGMDRNVGGFGHDPKTEQVESQLEKSAATCFDDQSVSEAKQIMLDSNVGDISVLNHETFLVGTTNLKEIAKEEDRENARNLREIRRSAARGK